jgi:hypothetical protein
MAIGSVETRYAPGRAAIGLPSLAFYHPEASGDRETPLAQCLTAGTYGPVEWCKILLPFEREPA